MSTGTPESDPKVRTPKPEELGQVLDLEAFDEDSKPLPQPMPEEATDVSEAAYAAMTVPEGDDLEPEEDFDPNAEDDEEEDQPA